MITQHTNNYVVQHDQDSRQLLIMLVILIVDVCLGVGVGNGG